MELKAKAEFIAQKLDELYPEVPIPLHHVDTFTLLIAVTLSAQTTDVRVNQVTPELFKLAPTAEKLAKLPLEQITEIIRPVGLANTKARNIKKLAQMLILEFNGEVPQTREELETLPGVGRKVASVVLSQGFGSNEFPVDTHIHRLAQRWGLSNGKNVVQTERDLKEIFPEASWNRLHLQIIYFGREYCKARGHNPQTCPICSVVLI